MAKLTKEQLKKLYDYGGTLSPKDWAAMIDNMDSGAEYDNSGTIIETTYKEAKALYESGQMIPGVYYEFPYYTRFDLSYEDTKSKLDRIVEQDVILKVYINRQGELKALGTERLLDTTSAFESDYSFKFKQANFNITYIESKYDEESDEDYEDNITEGIIETVKYQSVDIDWGRDHFIPEMLESYCNDNNISIVTYEYDDYITLIGNFAYSYIDDEEHDNNQLIIVSELSNKLYMAYNPNSYDMLDGETKPIKTPPGFLYNLNYKHCKHSHLLNGMINTSYNIIINANYVDDSYNILGLSIRIQKGDIKNCTFKSNTNQYLEIEGLYALDVDITLEGHEDSEYDDVLYYPKITNLYDRMGGSIILTSQSDT